MGYLIAGALIYFLVLAPRTTQITSTATRAPAPTVATTGGATTFTIPGVGSYTNIGGGQSVAISLDGNLLSTLFG